MAPFESGACPSQQKGKIHRLQGKNGFLSRHLVVVKPPTRDDFTMAWLHWLIIQPREQPATYRFITHCQYEMPSI